MKRYTVTLKHDAGRVRITTAARDAETAVQLVLKAENAPQSAVLSVKEQKTSKTAIKKRLEYLRREIIAEKISYSEIAELQTLAAHIPKTDTLLLEWAGIPESQEATK